jgi:excisionase family DNA binding protein
MTNNPSEPVGEEAAQKLIIIAEAAELSGLSDNHLRLLIRQNKLWGTKLGRTWVTTEKAVRDYLATNPRPGPKPKSTDAPDK